MTSGGPVPRKTPLWAVGLAILGWLIVGLTILGFVLLLLAMEVATEQRPSTSDLGKMVMLAGVAIWVGGIGWLLAIGGRSRRPNAASSGLKLWARFALVVGLLFCVGVPVFVAGGFMTDLERSRDPAKVQTEIEVCLVMSGPSFVLGAAVVICALIWGRRKRPPDVVHVFN